MVDLRFTDLNGAWQSITLPVSKLSESTFEAGVPVPHQVVDRHVQSDEGGCRLAIPDSETAYLDPSTSIPMLVLLCTLQDSITRDDDRHDPRLVCIRAVDFLKSSGVADRCLIGALCEFHAFQRVEYGSTATSSYFYLDQESVYRGGREIQRSSFPHDNAMNSLRSSIVESLIDTGIDVAMHHGRETSDCKSRIDIVATDLVKAADSLQSMKAIAKDSGRGRDTRSTRLVTFMPKPLAKEAGAGLTIQLSLWKGDEPVLSGHGYGGLSENGLRAIGGILKHRFALAAFCNPTTNSYRRLNESKNTKAFSGFSHLASIGVCRVPSYGTDPRSKQIEVCFPDPSANPYLSYAAILMAAIDGIQNKIDPGQPLELLHDSQRSESKVNEMPRSLRESLLRLNEDRDFLVEGDVFSHQLIDHWLAAKDQEELARVDYQPTPAEYVEYFDC